jgi:hypothetical protein
MSNILQVACEAKGAALAEIYDVDTNTFIIAEAKKRTGKLCIYPLPAEY